MEGHGKYLRNKTEGSRGCTKCGGAVQERDEGRMSLGSWLILLGGAPSLRQATPEGTTPPYPVLVAGHFLSCSLGLVPCIEGHEWPVSFPWNDQHNPKMHIHVSKQKPGEGLSNARSLLV